MLSFHPETPSKSASIAHRGFTLVEVMIVVAVVSILAAIAYPSYTRYVLRSKRNAVESYLMEVANLEQRYLLDARSYTANLSTDLGTSVPSNLTSSYTVTATVTSTPPGFTLTATPIGAQLADTDCDTITLDQANQKTASGNAGAASCW